MDLSVMQYAEKYRVSRTCVRDMIADGRLSASRTSGKTMIKIPPGHKPPLRYSGNPRFSDPSYQRDLARRPRPGRRKP